MARRGSAFARHYLEGHARLAARAPSPIGGAELASSLAECRSLARARACRCSLQADITRCGGLTEMARVAALAAQHGAGSVVPHSWKTGIGAAASRQPRPPPTNVPLIEMLSSRAVRFAAASRKLAAPEPVLDAGRLALPALPGLRGRSSSPKRSPAARRRQPRQKLTQGLSAVARAPQAPPADPTTPSSALTMRARNDGAAARGGREPPAVRSSRSLPHRPPRPISASARGSCRPWELGRPAEPISELWNGRDAERRASRGRRLCIGTNAKARQHQVHEPGLRFRPKLSGASPPNRASCATIAFLESDRPDVPRAGDAYGDIPLPGSGRAAWIAGAAAETLRGAQPCLCNLSGSARVRPAPLPATRAAESAMELSLKEWPGERPSPQPYQGMVSPS